MKETYIKCIAAHIVFRSVTSLLFIFGLHVSRIEIEFVVISIPD